MNEELMASLNTVEAKMYCFCCTITQISKIVLAILSKRHLLNILIAINFALHCYVELLGYLCFLIVATSVCSHREHPCKSSLVAMEWF